MGAATLAAGLMLPWLLGVAALAATRSAVRSAGAAGEVAWMAGAGYLVGAFGLTLWMRALSLIGIGFGAAAIAAPLAVATLALAYVAWRRDGPALGAAGRSALRGLIGSPGLTGAARAFWWLLVGWLALRFALLGLAVNWQPLYPWDAWLQWATKARVWYELGQLAPFALPDAWFAENGRAYFDAAPHYPPTVPLLQVWANIALGQWDDARMNWPWWQIAVALTLAVYGGLSRLGASPLAALFGAFMVATLPLANAHVALAGYADFPLAAYYTVAAIALVLWSATRNPDDAALAALLAVACTQIKNPGLFWALTFVPGVLVVLLPRHGLKIAAGGLGVAVLLLATLARAQLTIFNYRLQLDFDPAWSALAESYFLLGNWNLLWYAAIGVAVLARRQLFEAALAPLTVVLIAGLLFLFVVFGFTNARAWVADQTTVNRATLHLAPLIAVFLVLGFRAFASRWTIAHPASVASATPPTAVVT
jgi:hypothetical protein